jgi:hypothetical protein
LFVAGDTHLPPTFKAPLLSPSLEKDLPRGKRVFRFKAQLDGFMGMFVDNDSSKMGTRFISSGLLYFA